LIATFLKHTELRKTLTLFKPYKRKRTISLSKRVNHSIKSTWSSFVKIQLQKVHVTITANLKLGPNGSTNSKAPQKRVPFPILLYMFPVHGAIFPVDEPQPYLTHNYIQGYVSVILIFVIFTPPS